MRGETVGLKFNRRARATTVTKNLIHHKNLRLRYRSERKARSEKVQRHSRCRSTYGFSKDEAIAVVRGWHVSAGLVEDKPEKEVDADSE